MTEASLQSVKTEGRNRRSLERCTKVDLGRIDYLEAWRLQKRLVEARYQGLVDDLLLLAEHPHTYTTGRAGSDSNILFDEAILKHIGARFYRVDRGGDVTYHGPGQMVVYPIIDLRRWNPDLHKYLRSLEEIVIQTLSGFGIQGERQRGATGVWVGSEKIAAIGVHVSRWITSHGLALNVDPDLAYFGNIIPCGLRGKGVTSLARVLGREVSMCDVQVRLVEHFGREFRLEMVAGSREEVEEWTYHY